MANAILLKRKTTTGAASSTLALGEVALNTVDENLSMRNTAGSGNVIIGVPHGTFGTSMAAAADSAAGTALLDDFSTAATTSGLVPGSNGAGATVFLNGNGGWSVPGGGGDVSKVNTPVNNQLGVWTGDGTIEGDAALTFDTATDILNIGATNDGTLSIGGTTIVDNATGTITLSNITNYGLVAGDIPDLSATYEAVDATIIKEADLNTSDTLAGATDTEAASASAVKSYVDAAVAGGMVYKGGYNAATNTPDLDTAPSGVLTGDTYTVTADGTFFSASVQIGDVLVAEVDSATNEADWTIVNKNIGDVAPDFSTLVEDTAPVVTTDYLAYYDVTEGAHNRIMIGDLPMDGGTWT